MTDDTTGAAAAPPPPGAPAVTPDVPASVWTPLLPHLVRSVALLVPVVGFVTLWVVGTGHSVLDGLGVVGGRGTDLGPTVNSGLTFVGLVGLAFFGLIWAVSLFVGIREVIEEDGLVVCGAAAARAAVRDSVRASVDRLGPPFTARPGDADGHPTVRLGNGREQALVIVRTAGADLRVGWRVWRVRSTATLLTELYSGRSGHDEVALESDECSALRAAVRAAVLAAATEIPEGGRSTRPA